MENLPPESQFDLAAGIGHSQAFGLVAFHCSAAQASAMRQIHDSESYKTTGLTWDDFCPRHFGLSRRRVDSIIQNLKEFGEKYFHLCEMVRISPENYRQIAPKLEGETIELDGEMVSIAPENAARIRQAVAALKAPKPAPARRVRFDQSVLYRFRKRMIGWHRDVAALYRALTSDADRQKLLQTIEAQIFYLGELIHELDPK